MWLTFWILLCFSSRISGVCRHSFQTLCDNFEDYYPIIDSVTELIVGSENSEDSQLRSINSSIIKLDEMTNIKALTILGRIKYIERETFSGNKYRSRDMPMDYLKFYGNNIRRLRPITFKWMRVKRFSFENNNLEVLHGNAFGGSSFQSIDLSHNNLEEIDGDVFSDAALDELSTEELIITHNKLKTIRLVHFPSSLKVLKLDYNELSYLEGAFDNLAVIQELTVSHNTLMLLPELNHTQLSYIDFSFNNLYHLTSKHFQLLPKLEKLDLSHNELINPDIFDVFNPLVEPKVKLIFNVAYNHLTHLTRNDTLTNLVPILYGNPWYCKCWPRIQKLIKNRDDCDIQFFGNGKAPFCIDIAGADCATKKYDLDLTPLQPFLRLRENAKANCSLAPKKPRVVLS